MPFNGSGSFTRLYSWVTDAANSVNISSSRTDAEMNGFAAGLSNCLTRDGQSPPSADLPMGGKKLTNLGAATVGSDALNRDAADARYSLIGAALVNLLTFNNGGAGGASGTTFNGSAPITISFNSIGAAPLNSPGLTGTPTAPTPLTADNSTKIATTAWGNAAIAAALIGSADPWTIVKLTADGTGTANTLESTGLTVAGATFTANKFYEFEAQISVEVGSGNVIVALAWPGGVIGSASIIAVNGSSVVAAGGDASATISTGILVAPTTFIPVTIKGQFSTAGSAATGTLDIQYRNSAGAATHTVAKGSVLRFRGL